MTTALFANRYELLDSLGAGGMGIVFRAIDRLSGHEVALKRVKVQTDNLNYMTRNETGNTSQLETEMRLALAHEFQTLASLRHPNIISVLDYGFDKDKQPYFTMPLLEGAVELDDAVEGQAPSVVIKHLIRVLQALSYLHRRGIIHRDLKPSNVIVERDGQVIVLDFGIAMQQGEDKDVAGTPHYIAPEVLLGDPASVASDLYTVGVMAYQFMVGEHPFHDEDTRQMFHRVVGTEPNLGRIPSLGSSMLSPRMSSYLDDMDDHTFILSDDEATVLKDVDLKDNEPKDVDMTMQVDVEIERPSYFPPPPPKDGGNNPMATVIGKLLEKEPQRRYKSADEVINYFRQLVDELIETESEAIRESFLQAATFVGRERELSELVTALRQILPNDEVDDNTPISSAWLIAGESGVGKTRLINELRTQALVQGVLVVRGQGVEGGGLPYQLWRDIVPRLVLSVEVSDLEAGVLKAIVPNIDDLLGRDVPDVPELSGKAGQDRLIFTISDLFKRQTRPMLVLLEDLQWMHQSLLPLQHLLTVMADLPLILVGTYRDDDRPELPQELPQMKVMKLNRLKQDEIAKLTVSMLGETGNRREILTLLQRETEGNVFFVVEVVRALAEEAGQLSNVQHMELPETVFAGGVQTILQRRLERVPEIYDGLLRLVAVMGRQLDVSLLQHLMELYSDEFLPDRDLDTFFLTCANTAVFEIQDERWRFSHDKLREALLEGLADKQSATLNRMIAEAIEQVYADELDTYAEELLGHWEQTDQTDKEIYYLLMVADQLATTTAQYDEAQALLNRCLGVLDRYPSPEDRIRALRILGTTYERGGDYAQAKTYFEQSLRLAEETDNALERARALTEIGWVAEQQGEFDEATRLATEVLGITQEIGDEAGTALAQKNLGNVHRLRGEYETAQQYYEDSLAIRSRLDDRQGMAVTLNNLGLTAMYLGDLDKARDQLTEAYTIHKEIGARYEMAAGLDNLGIISYSSGDLEATKNYFEESLAIRREIGNRGGIASAINNLGMIAKVQEQFAEAQQYFEDSIAIQREIGDRPGLTNTLINLGSVVAAQGDTESADQYLREALVEAKALRAVPYMLEIVVGFADLQHQAGNSEKAAEWLGLVGEHPSKGADVENAVEPLLAKVRKALDDAVVEAALERGQSLVLETVVDSILGV